VTYLLDFRKFSLEELQSLEDVGPKVAGSVLQFFENADNIKMLTKLETLGVNFKSSRSERGSGGSLAEQSFLFTGTLNELKRSEAEALVEAQGGKILNGVSSKLNYLVVGEDAGSKLEKAKKIPSIRILSEKEFLQFIRSVTS
jgi:DNA ligase (NAD+)